MAEPDPNSPPAGGGPAADPGGDPPVHTPRAGYTEVPTAKFVERVRRDALGVIREELGVDIDEAKRMLAQARAGLAAAPPAAVAANTEEQRKLAAERDRLSTEREQLSTENVELKTQLAQAKKKGEDRVRQLEDEIAERDLRAAASLAGVQPGDLGYAVFTYAEAKAADDKIEPKTFFEGLRTSKPSIFGVPGAPPAAATPSHVPAETAPPASANPGGAPPNPAGAGAPPAAAEKVEDLDARKFQERTRDKYGFTPPLGG